ncbi:hypothetical protein Slin15195_G048600 [Septoria linicola]|uniref:Uncharacterized protein n=1 Tax=Septoria linicola TaxID=215465 RepID=A0A9Q9EH79_9PEZI|nr:hypothetical protein Slin14017_G052160 [Septoria linicola]USW51541.1 hypothetical protein Slin15195_G048600 [Septoria linicola]
MGLLIRIQKKLENKWLHKHGEHGKPVYYADPEEVDETTTRTSSSGSRPALRLTNLSFLASRRNSSQRQSTNNPPRSPSFFCRGSSAQPNARRSLQPQHARNGSNLSASTAARGSGSWRIRRGSGGDSTTRNDSDCTFRVPAFPDSGHVSRDSDPDIGFLPQSNEPLASPSQLGNSMTLVPSTSDNESQSPVRGLSSTIARGLAEDRDGRVRHDDLRARASSLTLGGPALQGVDEHGGPLSPGGLAERYEAPSAMSNEDLGHDATATGGLRGFEGDRDGFFGFSPATPSQPARSQTTAGSGAAAGSSNHARAQIEEARRNRRPFTTTRALTGY